MNLDWIMSYRVIVEEKSITQAAEKLNISQPALSKQLRSLESAYDSQLLHRSSKGITLTPAGEYLYEKGGQLLQQADSIARDMRQMHTLETITIGCLPSIATTYLTTFDLENHCVFIQNHSKALLHSLAEEHVHVSIIDRYYETDGLIGKDLFTERYILLAPKSYHMNDKKSLCLQDLEEYPLILHTMPCDTSEKIKAYAHSKGIQLNIVNYVPYGEFSYGYVMLGEGVTVVPERVYESVKHLNLDAIPLEDMTLTIRAVAKKQKVLDTFDKLLRKESVSKRN